MATGARLSIIGMYNMDNSILDVMLDYMPSVSRISNPDLAIVVPNVDFDGQQVIERIMIDCAELEIMWPDPDYFTYVLRVWCRNRQPIWQRFWETTIYKYNPIWNKDGTTERKVKTEFGKTINRTEEANNSGTVSDRGSITDKGNSELKVSGYNNPDYVPSESSTGGNMRDTQMSQTINLKDTNTEANTEGGTETITDTYVEQGNIGVTTTQAMIREERDLLMNDVVSFIVQDFKNYFCILVY